MGNFSDSPFEELQQEPLPPQGGRAPAPGGNRNFIILFVVLLAVFIISLVVMAVIIPVIQSSRSAVQKEQVALINAGNTATSSAATNESRVYLQKMAATASYVPPTETSTPLPSNTPVLVIPTDTPEPTATLTATSGVGGAGGDGGDRTATIAVLLTQAAGGGAAGGGLGATQVNVTPGKAAATALPQTGFAEDVGIPTLIGMAFLLIVVVFLARKLRTSIN